MGSEMCIRDSKTTTGDGLITALQVLAMIRRTGSSLKKLASGMERFPQAMLSVKVESRVDLEAEPAIRKAVGEVESTLGDRGRVVVRASGTEPVVRVMVEGESEDTVVVLAERLADSVRIAVGA